MLISVVVPVYNCEKTLELTMKGLLNQTYEEIEIILVNDGSKDNSALLCDKYAKEDKRVTVIHQENKGLSGARNSGINIAKGDYISFIDAGDMVKLDLYQSLMPFTEKKIDFIHFPYFVQNANGDRFPIINKAEKNITLNRSFIDEEMMPCLLNIKANEKELPVCFAVLALYKKSVIDKHCIKFDEKTRKWEDRDFIIEYLRFANNVVFYDKPLYSYICLDDGTSLSALYYPELVFERISKMKYREECFGTQYDFNTVFYFNTCLSVIIDLLKEIVNKENEQTAKLWIKKVFDNDFVVSLAKRAINLEKKISKYKSYILESKIDQAYIELKKKEKEKRNYKVFLKAKIKRIFQRGK